MDLPDYAAAADAAEHLLTGHSGQHRCSDGAYYGPRNWQNCPTALAVHALTSTLAQAAQLPHVACHDPETVVAVAQAMATRDGDPVLLAALDAEQAVWWIERARLGMEAHAALLDPTVPSA